MRSEGWNSNKTTSQKTVLMLMWKLTSSSDKDRKTKLTESRSSSSTRHKETAIRTPGAGPPPPGHVHFPPAYRLVKRLTLSSISLITSNTLVILGEEKHMDWLYWGRVDKWTAHAGTVRISRLLYWDRVDKCAGYIRTERNYGWVILR